MNSVVKNGLFQIPLYHGTSTLFVDPINKFGFGGINPIQQLRGNEFLKALLILADRAFLNDAEWQSSRSEVQRIADQVSFGDSFKNVGTHFIENNSDLCNDCRYKDFGGHEEVKKQVGVMSFLFKNSGKS